MLYVLCALCSMLYDVHVSLYVCLSVDVSVCQVDPNDHGKVLEGSTENCIQDANSETLAVYCDIAQCSLP